MNKNIIKTLYLFAQQHVGVVLFFVLALIGLMTFDDYGVSTDEEISRVNGIISYQYVFEGNPGLLTWKDRDYGVAFELPLVMIEKALSLRDLRTIFLMRHLVTHLFFLLGGFVAFIMLKKMYKSDLLAVAGFLLFVLHPRLYAHSFFNSKDIPFAVMFMITLYQIMQAFSFGTVRNYIFVGVLGALTTNIRILGVLLPMLFSLFILYECFIKRQYKKQLQNLLILSGVYILTLYITWPFLWGNPLENFAFTFNNMAHFRWDDVVLFMGEVVKGSELPWFYIPVWFIISTPLLYTLLIVVGIASVVVGLYREKNKYIVSITNKMNLFFLMLAIGPVVLVVMGHATLYSAWRQLYFIYAPLSLLGVLGLSILIQKLSRKTVMAVVVLIFISPLFFMMKYYPFHHLFFFEPFYFASPGYIHTNFEMDYWGVTFKKAYEELLDMKPKEKLYVGYPNEGGVRNVLILPKQARQRVFLTSHDKAEYVITNYHKTLEIPYSTKVQSILKFTVMKSTVCEIFGKSDSGD